jgi:hypothetical protein
MSIRLAFALCLLWAIGAQARVIGHGANVDPLPGAQLVQTSTLQYTGGPVTSVTVSLTSVAAGSSILVPVTYCRDTYCSPPGTGAQVSSVAGAGTCSLLTGPSPGTFPIEVWNCPNVSAGSPTLTVTFTADAYYINTRAIEVVAGAVPVDAGVANNVGYPYGAPGDMTISTAAPATFNDFVYSMVRTSSYTPVNGWPQWNYLAGTDCGYSNGAVCDIYKAGAPAGPYTLLWGSGYNSPVYDAAIVALKGPTTFPAGAISYILMNDVLHFNVGDPDGTLISPIIVRKNFGVFTGNISLSDNVHFKLSSTTLPSTILLNGTGVAGIFPLDVVATQAGLIDSPKTKSVTVSAGGIGVVRTLDGSPLVVNGVTSGNKMLVRVNACGDASCVSPATATYVTGLTPSGITPGTCVHIPNSHDNSTITVGDIWLCSGGHGDITYTAAITGTPYYTTVTGTELTNAGAVEAFASNSGNTSPATATTGTLSAAGEFVYSLLSISGPAIPQQTPLNAGWGGGEYQISTNTSPVTNTYTFSGTTPWVEKIFGIPLATGAEVEAARTVASGAGGQNNSPAVTLNGVEAGSKVLVRIHACGDASCAANATAATTNSVTPSGASPGTCSHIAGSNDNSYLYSLDLWWCTGGSGNITYTGSMNGTPYYTTIMATEFLNAGVIEGFASNSGSSGAGTATTGALSQSSGELIYSAITNGNPTLTVLDGVGGWGGSEFQINTSQAPQTNTYTPFNNGPWVEKIFAITHSP